MIITVIIALSVLAIICIPFVISFSEVDSSTLTSVGWVAHTCSLDRIEVVPSSNGEGPTIIQLISKKKLLSLNVQHVYLYTYMYICIYVLKIC